MAAAGATVLLSRVNPSLGLGTGLAVLLAISAAGLLSPAFFGLLYDPRYHEAGWMAQLSMIGLWFLFLHDSAGNRLSPLRSICER